MRLKVFTVYDAAAEAYQQPFLMHTKGMAIRAFEQTALDSNSTIAKHPDDFTLYEIGEYDDSIGQYVMHDNKIPLGTALEVITQKAKTNNVVPFNRKQDSLEN